jgi:hypothetical protein
MHPARQPGRWSFAWILLGFVLFVLVLFALYSLLLALLINPD